MNRGDLVTVKAYPDKLLERIVWQEYETYVDVVRPEVYAKAISEGTEPESAMGFPTEDVQATMGMIFSYILSQCNDYRNCHLDPLIHETVSPRQITKEDPEHWHLYRQEGGGWTTKTRDGCLSKLLAEVNRNYDRLYDEEGNHRV